MWFLIGSFLIGLAAAMIKYFFSPEGQPRIIPYAPVFAIGFLWGEILAYGLANDWWQIFAGAFFCVIGWTTHLLALSQIKR